MNQRNTISAVLNKKGYEHEVLPQAATGNLIDMANSINVRLQNVARSVLLSDGNSGLLLAILPASHCLDIAALGRQLHREFKPAESAAIQLMFPGHDAEHLPPFSPTTALPCIIDDSLADQDQIYFPTESMQFVRMVNEDFYDLLDNAWHGFKFSYPMPGHSDKTAPKQDLIILPAILEQRLTALDALPSVPETTRQLLRLLNNDNARVNELACIIEQDPMLSAQLLKQARSSLYGFGGSIESIQTAILQIFGYDTALHMAIGLSAAKSFKGSRYGRIGQKNIYQNAVLVSALSEALAKKMPVSKRPAKGSAQLAGLLHNLGYLLLAHLFSDEYEEINTQLGNKVDASAWDAINLRFATSPESIAAWLMEFWEMPVSLLTAQREQRNSEYAKKYANQANLIFIANRLLHQYGYGDATSHEIPVDMLERMGINEATALACAEHVMSSRSDLQHIAEQLVA